MKLDRWGRKDGLRGDREPEEDPTDGDLYRLGDPGTLGSIDPEDTTFMQLNLLVCVVE
jgi:hypothetical protein